LEHARFIGRISSSVSKLQGQYAVSSAFEFFSHHWAHSHILPMPANCRQRDSGAMRSRNFEKMPRRIGGAGERTAGIPRRAASLVVQPGEGPPHKKAPSAYATGQGYLCTRQQRKSGGSDPPLPKSQNQTRKCVPADSAHGWPADYAALAHSMCSRRKAAERTGGLLWGLPKRFPASHAAACRGRGEDRQGPLFLIIAGIRAQGR